VSQISVEGPEEGRGPGNIKYFPEKTQIQRTEEFVEGGLPERRRGGGSLEWGGELWGCFH